MREDRLANANVHNHSLSSFVLVVSMTCMCQTEGVYNMPTPLHITSNVYVNHMIDIHSAEFSKGTSKAFTGGSTAGLYMDRCKLRGRFLWVSLSTTYTPLRNSITLMVTMTNDCGKRSAPTMACFTAVSSRHPQACFGQISPC